MERTRSHKLIDIMVIGFCATLAGGEGFNDMEWFGKSKEEWFWTFLELPNGIPTHDTFNRVFQAIDPKAFCDCFLRWTEGVRSALSGEVVAIDAMGCQKKIAREIVEADADYVLALKGNHETVHAEVKAHFDDAICRWQKNPGTGELDFIETTEKDHGRIEIRRFWQSDKVDWFADLDQWEGLKSFGAVESIRDIGGVVTTERRYHLLSLTRNVRTFAKANRQHWGIENSVHWTLDVTFNPKTEVKK